MPPPDRWENYTALGNVIKGTRIVCFKVPLKYALVQKLPEDERFTPSALVKKMADSGHNLGLVIDLTFTRKYYNFKELTDKGVQYEKIFTKGHEVPNDFVFGRFAHVIDEYLEQSTDSSSVIGIHCTHGVNRTGYLVCRYMVESLSMPPDDAIAAFNEARGHELERENYIEDLRTRIPGEKTPFDPSATPPEETSPDTNNKRMMDRLSQPGYKADNSYSKLLEKHRSPYDNRNSNNSLQSERDHEMRPHRGQPRNDDRKLLPRQQRYRDDGGGYPGNGYGSYQGNDHDWHQGYGDNQGHTYGGNHGYDQSSHYDSHKRRRRSGDHYQNNDYAYDGNYSYDVDFSQEECHGQNGMNNRRSAYIKQHWNNDDYRSPMKYSDWSADDTDRYDKSGWGSGPRGGSWKQDGYNHGGYNRGGYRQGGYNRGGYNQGGYNRGGYNRRGYNRGGHNQGGWR
ncbi:RNA/RNP complex-1-interacting phosphatase-like isoform X2 [Haliotis asinina]|uniref:RNA/RNP complex-1-interacting phosphatase-like isoform X2 n=1 Tax=Haliotis asinina TaxID=109174 RepID=UPI0035327C66